MKEHIDISLVIPTLNAAAVLPLLLERLAGQKREVGEILVVDSGSVDQTVAIVRRSRARLMTIKRDSFDHGGTRNLAAANTRGDTIVFMTQDALPDGPDTLEELVKPLSEKDVIVSYGRHIPKQGAGLPEFFLRMYNYPPASSVRSQSDVETMGIGAFRNSNVCAAYRRKEFEMLRGFPEQVACNEDMLFAAKAILGGYKVAYRAEAAVIHSHSYSCVELFRRYFDIASSLEHEPALKKLGRLEQKGFSYLLAQLSFLLLQEKKLSLVPGALLEAACRLCGYKLGERHRLFSPRLKQYLGLNDRYWNRQAAHHN